MGQAMPARPGGGLRIAARCLVVEDNREVDEAIVTTRSEEIL
jgi:hypothetical protein